MTFPAAQDGASLDDRIQSLDSRIQSLAQELQDLTFDFTLSIDPGVIKVDSTYRPPWQLQINRRTRQNLSPVYYGDSIFKFDLYATSSRNSRSTSMLVSWLQHIDPQDRSMIREIRLGTEPPINYDYGADTTVIASYQFQCIDAWWELYDVNGELVTRTGLLNSDHIVRCECLVGEEDDPRVLRWFNLEELFEAFGQP